MKPSILNVLVIGVIMAILLFVDSLLYKSFVAQSKTASYQQTVGTITASYKTGSKNGDANVKYSYQVNGSAYTSGCVKKSLQDYSIDPVANVLARYPKGASVSVYYNPNYPEDAVLEPGLKKDDLTSPGMIVLGILNTTVFLSLVYLIWILLRADKRKRRSQPW